jgi:thioredoxin-like negative regulator of GroEL
MRVRLETTASNGSELILPSASNIKTLFFAATFKHDGVSLHKTPAKYIRLEQSIHRFILAWNFLILGFHNYKYFLQLVLSATLFGAANTTQALPYIPDSADAIVAHWPRLESRSATGQSNPEQDPIKALATAQAYLQHAMQPGQSNLYGQAQAVLAPIMANNPSSSDLWLTWAQVLQHQHQFTQAQQALERVLVREPHQVSANLLAARLALIRGNVPLAKRQCLSLLGHGDLITISACSLEAASYANAQALQASYTQLAQMTSTGLGDDPEGFWIHQILADMALRLGDAQAALGWLTPMPAQASVSQWSQWADAQLALQREQDLLQTLGALVRNVSDQDDALLVRLALAEKRLATGDTQWQQLISAKIRLREARGDTQHAADLCLFYLDIQPDAQKALAWAEQNYQQAQEPADQKLLARAQAINLQQGH